MGITAKFYAYSFAAFLAFVAITGIVYFQEPSNASRSATAASVELSNCAALNDLHGESFDWTIINSNRVRLNATWDVSISRLPVPFWENLWFFQRWTTNGKNYAVQVVYDETTPVSANAHFLIL